MVRSGADHDAGHHADFRSADLGKYVYGIVAFRLIDFDSATNYLDFVSQATVIKTGSSAGYRFWITTKQDGSDSARRRGISNSHFADTKEANAIVSGSLC